MRRFSGSIGENYDLFRLAVPHHDELQRCTANIVADAVRGTAQPTMVDIGCGTGITSKAVATEVSRGEILAIDSEATTLEQAKSNTYAVPVRFIHDDAVSALRAMETHSADVVFSAFLIHNLPKSVRTELLREAHRVLKPNGMFVNADKYANNDNRQHTKDLKQQLKSFDVFRDAARNDLYEAWSTHYEEDEKIKMSENEGAEQLRSCGFHAIQKHYRVGMEAIISARA